MNLSVLAVFYLVSFGMAMEIDQSFPDAWIPEEVSAFDVPMLKESIWSDDPTALNLGLYELEQRFLILPATEAIDSMSSNSILSRLKELLSTWCSPYDLQLRIMKLVGNLLCGNTDQTVKILNHGLMDDILYFLRSDDPVMINEAVFAVSNAAADCSELRNALLDAGVLDRLNSILAVEIKSGILNGDLAENTVHAIFNIYRTYPVLSYEAIRLVIPNLLGIFINDQLDSRLENLYAKVLTFFTQIMVHNPEKIHTDFVAPFVKTINFFPKGSLGVLGDLILENDEYSAAFIISSDGLSKLKTFLDISQSMEIRKEVLWIISNITSGPSVQMFQVVEAGLVPHLVNSLFSHLRVAQEAGFAVTNLTTLCPSNHKFAEYLLESNIIQGFFHFFSTAISPLAQPNESTSELMAKMLASIAAIFACNPAATLAAVCQVNLPRNDELQAAGFNAFGLLKLLETSTDPVLANNASVLVQVLQKFQQ